MRFQKLSAEVILKYLPANVSQLRYYEPFIGAGALFLELRPRWAIINDNNEQLTLTYKAIRDQVDELIVALQIHKERDCQEYFYETRNQDLDRAAFASMSDVQKAARLIYLNKTCYNGLYRVNSQGFFNVPYGRNESPAIYDEPLLRAIHKYFQGEKIKIKILSGDFARAVQSAQKGSFIYFDPPYHGPKRANFTDYQAGGFGEDEQRRLRDVFRERTEAGAKCLLSNSDTDFIRRLYDDKRFEIIIVKARRAINSVTSKRGEVNETLIKNWR
jgi:DNA adenine methylase